MASLLNKANESHNLRSAFTRGSLRGSIFIECVMNNALIRLLKITPGVVFTQKGLRYQVVQFSEQLNLLTMKNAKVDFGIGKWIRVSKGLYKGDVGLVVGLHSWGSTVLLVPRIPSPPTTNLRKRKVTTVRPPPRLCGRDSSGVTHNPDGSYTLGRLSFERGLLVKEFDYHSIVSDVRDMPFETYFSFLSCGHTDVLVSTLPRPQEWCFEQDDPVFIRSSKELGLFKTVHADYAEVEIQGGLRRVPWNEIIKKITPGSFVKIDTGAFNGKSGWVVEITDHMATIVDSVEHGNPVSNRLNTIYQFKTLSRREWISGLTN